MESIGYDDQAIRRKIFSMIIPITLENILQMTAGLVSMVMVGRIDALAVGVIGLANIVVRLIWAVLRGISIGTTIHVAKSYGAKNSKNIIRVSLQGFILSMVFSLVFFLILLFNSDMLSKVFNASPELLHWTADYLKIIAFSVPATGVILLVSGIFQGMGDAKTPMAIIGGLNIINIFLSYVLIFGNFGFPNYGIKGAAYAYCVAYNISALVALLILLKKSKAIWKSNKPLKILSISELISVMRYGFPTSLETIIWQISSIIVTRAVLTYGETAYTAYQLGIQVESVSFMPAMGLAVCATAFIGQSIGSSDAELGRKYFNHLYKITLFISIVAGGSLVLFPSVFMGMLTSNAEVAKIGGTYLIIMGLSQIPQNLTGLYNGVLRATGFLKTPLMIVLIGIWTVRIPTVLIFAFYMKTDILWIWISMGLDLFTRYILSYMYFKKKGVFNKMNSKIFEENYII